jgi:uncharacterized protein
MPRERRHDPGRFDVHSFAAEGSIAEGSIAADALVRWRESQHEPPRPGDAVAWQAQGSRVPRPGAAPWPRLSLRLDATARLQCQRCLGAIDVPVAVEREFLFVASEAEAERLDGERDDADVLVASDRFDLGALIEDELLLALPIVPRHEVCPQPLLVPAGAADIGEAGREAGAPHPFAALAGWRRDPGATDGH